MNPRAPESPLASPPIVQRVVADDAEFVPGDVIELKPSVRRLEIEFASVNFVSPWKTHFRYMIEGHDQAWIDVGTARRASYRNLRAGQYEFRVAARHNGGMWRKANSRLCFSVPPGVYESTWSVVVLVVALALLLMERVLVATPLLGAPFSSGFRLSELGSVEIFMTPCCRV